MDCDGWHTNVHLMWLSLSLFLVNCTYLSPFCREHRSNKERAAEISSWGYNFQNWLKQCGLLRTNKVVMKTVMAKMKPASDGAICAIADIGVTSANLLQAGGMRGLVGERHSQTATVWHVEPAGGCSLDAPAAENAVASERVVVASKAEQNVRQYHELIESVQGSGGVLARVLMATTVPRRHQVGLQRMLSEP